MTRKVSIILSLSIAFVTLLIISRSGILEETLEMWKTLSARTFLCALSLYGITYPLRALRWILLTGDKRTSRALWEYTVITGIHTAAANFLPFKSGELAFPVLLKERGYPYSNSLVFLLMGRFMDLAVMITLFALFYLGPGGFFPVLMVLVVIFSLRRKAFSLYERISRTVTFLQKFLHPLGRLSEISTGGFISMFLLTSLVWVLKLMAVSEITSAVSGFPMLRTLLLALGAEMAFLIPVSGWLGLGNYEAGWAMASTLVDPSMDGGGAFFAHTFLIMASAVAGLASLYHLCCKKRGRA